MSYKRNISGNVSLRQYVSLSDPRVLTTTLNQSEIATLEGDRFSFAQVFTVAAGASLYIYGEIPLDANISVGFENRLFKTDDGSANLKIYGNPTVGTLGAAIPLFNENSYASAVKPAKLELNEVLIGNISDLGTLREEDFVSTNGVGANTSGGVSADTAFRIYKPGDKFLAHIENTHTGTNRVLIGYSWIEAPTALLGE